MVPLSDCACMAGRPSLSAELIAPHGPASTGEQCPYAERCRTVDEKVAAEPCLTEPAQAVDHTGLGIRPLTAVPSRPGAPAPAAKMKTIID